MALRGVVRQLPARIAGAALYPPVVPTRPSVTFRIALSTAASVSLVRAAGITSIGLHGARHSYTEIALAPRCKPDVVSRTRGHASASFTADQYSHDSDAAVAEAAAIVGRAIEGT
jgi:integrase